MPEWLDNNNILIYSTHNEVKSVITERSINILNAKIFTKITANDSKSYLPYLSKLVNQFSNTYQYSINEKPIIIFTLTETIETNHKDPKFNVNDRVRITRYKKLFSKSYTENWSREIFIIDYVLKTNFRTYKIKICTENNSRKFL